MSSIYIDVELHPDSPTDKAQKVNTAGIMVTQLGLSQESALEEIGFEDPAEELKKGIFERLVMHEVDMKLQREQMELEMAMKAKEMQMQFELESMRQEQMAAQQKALLDQQGGQPAPEGQDPNMVDTEGGQIPMFEQGGGAGQQGIPQVPFAQGAPGENAAGAGNPALTGAGNFPGEGGG